MPYCMCDRLVCQTLWDMREIPMTHPKRRRIYRRAIRKKHGQQPKPDHLPPLGTEVTFVTYDDKTITGLVVEHTNSRTKYRMWMGRVEGTMPDGSITSRWCPADDFQRNPVQFTSARTGAWRRREETFGRL